METVFANSLAFIETLVIFTSSISMLMVLFAAVTVFRNRDSKLEELDAEQ